MLACTSMLRTAVGAVALIGIGLPSSPVIVTEAAEAEAGTSASTSEARRKGRTAAVMAENGSRSPHARIDPGRKMGPRAHSAARLSCSAMPLVPIVIERTARGEREFDIYSRL